jgi:hypothetical protein
MIINNLIHGLGYIVEHASFAENVVNMKDVLVKVKSFR